MWKELNNIAELTEGVLINLMAGERWNDYKMLFCPIDQLALEAIHSVDQRLIYISKEVKCSFGIPEEKFLEF